MAGRGPGWARLTARLLGCGLAAAVGLAAAPAPPSTIATPPDAIGRQPAVTTESAAPGGRIPYDDIRAWFALLHRVKIDGLNDQLGIFIDGFDPNLNVATLFVNITGIPPGAFPSDEVIDLRDLRRTRPDLARQLGAPNSVTHVWALSRFSAEKAALTQLRKLVGRPGKPEGRFIPNFFHSEPALFQALKAAEERLRQQGHLGKQDSLLRRLLDVFSERDFCPRCDPYLRELLERAGMLDQVGLHSMVALGDARQGMAQSATQELAALLEEFGAEALAAVLNNTSGGPALPPNSSPGGSPSPGGGPTSQGGPTGAPLSVEDLAALLSRPEGQDLGGIDFSSLELRYLSESPSDDDSELQYAFRASDPAGGDPGTVVDGLRNAVQASDAFFVWLALPQSKFWVNLNPDEPNRIMDSAFGRTDAGRVLLESDFLLKRVDYELMNPDTTLGDRYWNQLRPGPDGSYCMTYRVWIVPGTAKVRETEDSVYVVDAPLDVKMRRDQIASVGCGQQPKSTQVHNAGVYRRLLLPRVKQAVNNAPEFAPLRRVYLSRVVAEWYRQNSATVPSAYSDVIDSGNIERWQLSGSWRPRQTFNEYVRSFDSGEFDYRERVVEGNVVKIYTYRTGGVDFTRLFKQNLTADAFESIAPGLTETVAKGLDQATVDPRTKNRWLGGTAAVEVAADEPGRPADEAAAPDDETALSVTPDDPWTRDSAPYVVPLMLLAGAGLIGWAVVRERRRHPMRGPR